MGCLEARESISARLDGESSEATESLAEAHLQRCEACQAWKEAAHEVTRRARMSGWTPPSELPDFVGLVAAAASPRVSWLLRVRAVLLGAAALGQLALAIALLTAVADPMGMHGDHELGVFDVTLGVAFAVGAFKPKLAAGLAWPCGVAAAGLLVTATVDVIGHRTFEFHELQHLIAICGALLLCWSARDARRGPQGLRREPVPAMAMAADPIGAARLRGTAA
jgi:predicted anti-sigma-YlaC factor YlaD